MFTVSLIGADGVGKTSVGIGLLKFLPLPAKYIYMGLNVSAANFALPTTLAWDTVQKRYNREVIGEKKNPSVEDTDSYTFFYKQIQLLRKALSLINQTFEEFYRQGVALFYLRLRYIVIFDRHFKYDFYYTDAKDKKKQVSFKARTLARMRKLLMPEPDLVICLDAPPEVAFERKNEFDLDILEYKRQQYLQLQYVIKNFIVIDATQNLETVIRQVGESIIEFAKKHKKD